MYTHHADLWSAIQAINDQLLQQEPDCLSKATKDGNVCYQPQYLLDAVNEHLGADNWREEVTDSHEVRSLAGRGTDAEREVPCWEITVLLYVRCGDEWLCKGPSFGFGRGDRDANDAKKAALSDARKKNFAAWSIGGRPFRGELKAKRGGGRRDDDEYERPAPRTAPAPPKAAAPPAPLAEDVRIILERLETKALTCNYESLEAACVALRFNFKNVIEVPVAQQKFEEKIDAELAKRVPA